MGYNEQIAVANRRHRERLAAATPSQRAIRRWGLGVVLIVAGAALWLLHLGPIWKPIAAWMAG